VPDRKGHYTNIADTTDAGPAVICEAAHHAIAALLEQRALRPICRPGPYEHGRRADPLLEGAVERRSNTAMAKFWRGADGRDVDRVCTETDPSRIEASDIGEKAGKPPAFPRKQERLACKLCKVGFDPGLV